MDENGMETPMNARLLKRMILMNGEDKLKLNITTDTVLLFIERIVSTKKQANNISHKQTTKQPHQRPSR